MSELSLQMTNSATRTRLFIFIGAVLLVFASWVGVIDKQATDYVDGALVQSSIAFGIARTFNAIISVAQSTQLHLSVGAGVSVAVGEVLDPLNDLIEQYSTMMKLSIGSLVIQKLLIEITSNIAFKMLFTLSALALLTAIFFRQSLYFGVLTKTFIFLALLRFAVVLAIFFNGVVNTVFIAPKADHEIRILQAISEEEQALQLAAQQGEQTQLETNVTTLNESRLIVESEINLIAIEISAKKEQIAQLEEQIRTIRSDQGFWQSLLEKNEKLDALDQTLKVVKFEQALLDKNRVQLQNELSKTDGQIAYNQNRLEGKPNGVLDSIGDGFSKLTGSVSSFLDAKAVFALKEKLESFSENILNLTALFIFKTLILPLLFLYLLVKGTNSIWQIDIRQKLTEVKDELSNKSN